MSTSIPNHMRAARLANYNNGYKVEEVKVPKDLGSNDVLIKVIAAGIGSHEPVGIVVDVGSEAVKNGKIKPGDRVGTINPYGHCGNCNGCSLGIQFCDTLKGMVGVTMDGGFAEYVKADARVVSKLPESISSEEAAPLFCAGATAYAAIQIVDPKPGEWVVVEGIGGLGHLAIQYLKAMKCNVIAIDNREKGLELANEVPQHLRPDKTFLIDNMEAKTKCAKELQSGLYASNPGVDKAVITTDGRDLVAWSQQFLRKGGQIVDVGIPTSGPLEVDSILLNTKQQTIRGSLISTPEQCQDMINLHAQHQCRVHIEKTYHIDEINQMLEHYQSKSLKGRLCMVFP